VGQVFGSVVLVVAAMFGLLTAWMAATSPERFASQLGLEVAGSSGRNEVRAQYAGFFLAAALVCVAALAGFAPRQAAFLLLCAAFGGCIAGRLASLVANRGFGGYTTLIRALFAIDAIGFLAGAAAFATS